jgi:putative acetyltransferase
MRESWLPEVLPLRQASRQVVRELGFLQNHFDGASAAQCHALLELEHHGTLTSGDLAELLSVDKSTASRTASELVRRGWARVTDGGQDRRRKPLVLSARGKRKLESIHRTASGQVDGALRLLGPEERARVLEGMQLYAKALGRSRAQSELEVRPIERRDDPEVARLIRTVMPEFGACGPGFAIMDPEVDAMHAAYTAPGSAYWVVTRRGRVVGGGGYARLEGAQRSVCELRKMYFLHELRGLGVGARLLSSCLEHAARDGYELCYLETLEGMTRARRLYERFGFERLERPMGATGHYGCDVWYARKLRAC